MDVSLVIRHRLNELGLEQKDLAAAAQVTESYISQLLARRKAPPAPGRTDIYERIGQYLKLPSGELSRLAQEFPPGLKGKKEVEIAREVEEQIERVKRSLRKELRVWGETKGKGNE